MKITLDEIKRLEKLSALSSSEEKLKGLVKDLLNKLEMLI